MKTIKEEALKEQPLPEPILELIAEKNIWAINKFHGGLNLNNNRASQLIYYYSVVGETFGLKLQETLINEVKNNTRRSLSKYPLSPLLKETIDETLYIITSKFNLEINSLGFNQYKEFLEELAKDIVDYIMKPKN